MMKDYSLLVYNLDVAGGVGKKGKDRSGPVSPSREMSSAIRVISSPLPETWYEPLSSHRSVDGHREGLAHGPPGKKCRRFGMRYIGVDVHKTNFVVCLLTAQGKPRGLTFSLDAEGQAAFSRHLRAEDEVTVEVGQNAYYFYEQMCAKVKRAVLVDTHRFALISRSKKKTSRQAATLLACFLKLGWLPTVTVPDQRVRQLRQLFQARESLVEMTTKLKNMGHGPVVGWPWAIKRFVRRRVGSGCASFRRYPLLRSTSYRKSTK
jgi:transposase